MKLCKSQLALARGRVNFTVAHAQNGKWKVGQHVEVHYIDRTTEIMAWRKATVLEVFNWGAHVKFDDDGEIESIQNDNIRVVGATENKEKPKANSSLEKIFKHAILENYEAEINGATTSPLKVGVTFAGPFNSDVRRFAACEVETNIAIES